MQTKCFISNVNSELHTPYGIDCDEPFIAEPTEGIIAPFGTATITCTFKPKSACVFEATCVVKYGANFSHAKTTRFEGIGKTQICEVP